MTMRLPRLGLLLLLLALPCWAAMPTEWIAASTYYAKCPGISGTTNLSSSGAGADFAHSLACTINPATDPPLKLGTIIRACAHVTVTTGSSSPQLQFKLKAGATTLYAQQTPFGLSNNVTRNDAFCWRIVVGGNPGASVPIYTSLESFVTAMAYTGQASSVAQPVNVNTLTALAFTFVSQFSAAGTGTNSCRLDTFTLEYSQ